MVFEYGGGIIKRHSLFALLFALSIAMLSVPSAIAGMDIQNVNENNVINIDQKDIQKVDAATYKKVYYKKYYKAYYKKWYKSYGRWKYYWASHYKYKWTYKYVKTNSVSASSSYTSTSNTYKTTSTSDSDSDSDSGSVSTSGLKSVASDMNKKYNHRSGSSTTAAGVRRTGYGDCWGLADLAAQELKKKGYKVRVVQGASRDSYRHRWVQYSANGKWNTFESTMITKRFGSKHYSYAIASVRTVIKYY
ncbi:MAG: transglutaminase domain-containing protein [Methanomicrobiales archaeon]